jgi:hypothetical protein
MTAPCCTLCCCFPDRSIFCIIVHIYSWGDGSSGAVAGGRGNVVLGTFSDFLKVGGGGKVGARGLWVGDAWWVVVAKGEGGAIASTAQVSKLSARELQHAGHPPQMPRWQPVWRQGIWVSVGPSPPSQCPGWREGPYQRHGHGALAPSRCCCRRCCCRPHPGLPRTPHGHDRI